MSLRYLFIDFDSFFASVEQHCDPRLRGRPIGVVPSLNVDTTCCIAASYEAKAYGVRTGTKVRDARFLCPDITFVEADHSRYIQIHHRIKEILERCLHIERVLSIDEMYGQLPPHWQSETIARAKAAEMKAALKAEIGPCITGSIGIGPNRFLAKIASKMRKPDGLMLIFKEDLPHILYELELTDLYGIRHGMSRRLRQAGIHTVQNLCEASRSKLRRAWGSVEGERYWNRLRGEEVPDQVTTRRSISHSHVLAPQMRTHERGLATLHRLLQKACRRLRTLNYFTGRLQLSVKFDFRFRWKPEKSCFPTQDTIALADMLEALWQDRPDDEGPPCQVGLVFLDLLPAQAHTPSLFQEENQPRRLHLQKAMDQINIQYGSDALYYAKAHQAQKAKAAPMRIAFTHIPDLSVERD